MVDAPSFQSKSLTPRSSMNWEPDNGLIESFVMLNGSTHFFLN